MIESQKELYENLKRIRKNEELSKDLEEIFQILDKTFRDVPTKGNEG